MLSEQERKERLSQLGASDIHKIMNLDNKGAQDLWKEKLGLIDREEFSNKYTVAGNLLEQDCMNYYFEGKRSYKLHQRIEHPEIENFVVSTDGIEIVDGNSIPVEFKTINFEKFTTLGNDLRTINRSYYLQLHAQMSALQVNQGFIVFNAVTEQDLEQPLLYEPSAIKQHVIHVQADNELSDEIEQRASYFLYCMKFKKRPREIDFISQLM